MLYLLLYVGWSFALVNCNIKKKNKSGKGPATTVTLDSLTAGEGATEKTLKKEKVPISDGQRNKDKVIGSTQDGSFAEDVKKNPDNKEEKQKEDAASRNFDLENKNDKNTSDNKEEMNPTKGNMTKKEENIAKGAVRNKNEYPTFGDVESDWDSGRKTKEQMKDKTEKTREVEKNEGNSKDKSEQNKQEKVDDVTDAGTKQTQDDEHPEEKKTKDESKND